MAWSGYTICGGYSFDFRNNFDNQDMPLGHTSGSAAGLEMEWYWARELAGQNFLDVDPHFGTREEFRDFVRAAHEQGIYVILDIVAHHTGNVFGYDASRYMTHDPAAGQWCNDPRWDGKGYAVKGIGDADGAVAKENAFPIHPRFGNAVDADVIRGSHLADLANRRSGGAIS
jgi:hypothetical protein